jgi:hypothetical protein
MYDLVPARVACEGVDRYERAMHVAALGSTRSDFVILTVEGYRLNSNSLHCTFSSDRRREALKSYKLRNASVNFLFHMNESNRGANVDAGILCLSCTSKYSTFIYTAWVYFPHLII